MSFCTNLFYSKIYFLWLSIWDLFWDLNSRNFDRLLSSWSLWSYSIWFLIYSLLNFSACISLTNCCLLRLSLIRLFIFSSSFFSFTNLASSWICSCIFILSLICAPTIFLGLTLMSSIFSPIEALRDETPFHRAVIDCFVVVFILLFRVWFMSMNLEVAVDLVVSLFSGKDIAVGSTSSLMFISSLLYFFSSFTSGFSSFAGSSAGPLFS